MIDMDVLEFVDSQDYLEQEQEPNTAEVEHELKLKANKAKRDKLAKEKREQAKAQKALKVESAPKIDIFNGVPANLSGLSLDIGFTPRPWQEEALNLFSKDVTQVVLAVHRRAGKTHLAAVKLITHALQKPGLYAYILPEIKQFTIVAWPVFQHYLKPLQNVRLPDGSKTDLVKMNATDHSISFYNGSQIKPFSGVYGDSIRGTKLRGAVFDEVAQVPPKTWSECAGPALSDTKDSWVLFIGTPNGIDLFSELYDQGQDPNLPWIASKRFTVYETNAIDPKKLEQQRLGMSENSFRREYLCDFAASAEDQLMNVEDVERAMQRYLEMKYHESDFQKEQRANVFMGVDVSRLGDDSSAIFVRTGNRAELVYMQRGLDTTALADAVVQMYRKYKPDALYIDGTGVGGGVVDQVRACNIECHDINFSSKSTDPMYANKRTEIWGKMAEWIKRRGAVNPSLRDLKIDLPAPLYKKDERGMMALEKKTEIKKRIGRSPDLGDALALTFSGLVPEFDVPDTIKISRRYHQVAQAPLSPFERYEREINDRGKRRSRDPYQFTS